VAADGAGGGHMGLPLLPYPGPRVEGVEVGLAAPADPPP